MRSNGWPLHSAVSVEGEPVFGFGFRHAVRKRTEAGRLSPHHSWICRVMLCYLSPSTQSAPTHSCNNKKQATPRLQLQQTHTYTQVCAVWWWSWDEDSLNPFLQEANIGLHWVNPRLYCVEILAGVLANPAVVCCFWIHYNTHNAWQGSSNCLYVSAWHGWIAPELCVCLCVCVHISNRVRACPMQDFHWQSYRLLIMHCACVCLCAIAL